MWMWLMLLIVQVNSYLHFFYYMNNGVDNQWIQVGKTKVFVLDSSKRIQMYERTSTKLQLLSTYTCNDDIYNFKVSDSQKWLAASSQNGSQFKTFLYQIENDSLMQTIVLEQQNHVAFQSASDRVAVGLSGEITIREMEDFQVVLDSLTVGCNVKGLDWNGPDYLAYCCRTHCGVLSFQHDGTVKDHFTDRYASQAGATSSQIVFNDDGLALVQVQSQLESVFFLDSVSFAQEQLTLASSETYTGRTAFQLLTMSDDAAICVSGGDNGLVTFYRDGQGWRQEEGPVVAADVEIKSTDVSPSGSHLFAVTQTRIFVFREGPELQPQPQPESGADIIADVGTFPLPPGGRVKVNEQLMFYSLNNYFYVFSFNNKENSTSLDQVNITKLQTLQLPSGIIDFDVNNDGSSLMLSIEGWVFYYEVVDGLYVGKQNISAGSKSRVSLSEEVAVIGIKWSVYVYQKQNSSWSQKQTFNAGEGFGHVDSVQLSDDDGEILITYYGASFETHIAFDNRNSFYRNGRYPSTVVSRRESSLARDRRHILSYENKTGTLSIIDRYDLQFRIEKVGLECESGLVEAGSLFGVMACDHSLWLYHFEDRNWSHYIAKQNISSFALTSDDKYLLFVDQTGLNIKAILPQKEQREKNETDRTNQSDTVNQISDQIEQADPPNANDQIPPDNSGEKTNEQSSINQQKSVEKTILNVIFYLTIIATPLLSIAVLVCVYFCKGTCIRSARVTNNIAEESPSKNHLRMDEKIIQ